MSERKKNINRIELEFPNGLSRIAGQEYGYDIYISRVLPSRDDERMNCIVFPDSIMGISISFVRGLMKDELNRYGRHDILNHFSFRSCSEETSRRIVESLYF